MCSDHRDGAGTHRTMEAGSWEPAKMNMNKSTEERPVTLNDKLKELNIWSPGLCLEEARKRLLETDEFKNQKMAIEALAERYECLVMFLPCAHPVLNPIERYWRLVKMTARKANSPPNRSLVTSSIVTT